MITAHTDQDVGNEYSTNALADNPVIAVGSKPEIDIESKVLKPFCYCPRKSGIGDQSGIIHLTILLADLKGRGEVGPNTLSVDLFDGASQVRAVGNHADLGQSCRRLLLR